MTECHKLERLEISRLQDARNQSLSTLYTSIYLHILLMNVYWEKCFLRLLEASWYESCMTSYCCKVSFELCSLNTLWFSGFGFSIGQSKMALLCWWVSLFHIFVLCPFFFQRKRHSWKYHSWKIFWSDFMLLGLEASLGWPWWSSLGNLLLPSNLWIRNQLILDLWI